VKVQFHPDVYKQFQRLPRETFRAALDVIVALGAQPRPPGALKLAGSASDWRIRIGEYRIIYEINDKAETITVFRVVNRSEAYR